MKKVTTVLATLGYLASAAKVFAQDVPINIPVPGTGGLSPAAPLGRVIGNIITVVMVIAILAVLFMLIFGAFEWITSGGDKEQVAKARGRIVNALIGLVIIAAAFLIVRVVGDLVGIDLQNLVLPKLDAP